jgi:hypothetical protein
VHEMLLEHGVCGKGEPNQGMSATVLARGHGGGGGTAAPCLAMVLVWWVWAWVPLRLQVRVHEPLSRAAAARWVEHGWGGR